MSPEGPITVNVPVRRFVRMWRHGAIALAWVDRWHWSVSIQIGPVALVWLTDPTTYTTGNISSVTEPPKQAGDGKGGG